MKTTRKFYAEWRYYLLLSGFLIIVISEMDTINLCKFVLLYSFGFLLAFSGSFILWKDRPIARSALNVQPVAPLCPNQPKVDAVSIRLQEPIILRSAGSKGPHGVTPLVKAGST
jgi:hypothetical protein